MSERRITIIVGGPHGFDVEEDGRICNGLSWDEMLGQVAMLTIPPSRVGHGFDMRTPVEWEALHAERAARLRGQGQHRRGPGMNMQDLLAQLDKLPTVRASEIDGEESDGTPRHWRNRPYVSLTQLRRLLMAFTQQQAEAIHYPQCWDTAAYPTVESALAEVAAFFRCTNQDTHGEQPDALEAAYQRGRRAGYIGGFIAGRDLAAGEAAHWQSIEDRKPEPGPKHQAGAYIEAAIKGLQPPLPAPSQPQGERSTRHILAVPGGAAFVRVAQSTAPKSPQAAAQSAALEPVAEWQWRPWWRGEGGEPQGWGEWQRVKPRNKLQTLDDAVQEIRDFIAQGSRYELRALYATPSAAMALLGESGEDAKRKLLGLVSEYGDARIMASHGRIERADVEEAWQDVKSAIDALTGTGRKAPPLGWLYDWTHSSATGRPDEQFTGFTTDEAHARKHDNPRPVYAAPAGTGRKEQSNG